MRSWGCRFESCFLWKERWFQHQGVFYIRKCGWWWTQPVKFVGRSVWPGGRGCSAGSLFWGSRRLMKGTGPPGSWLVRRYCYCRNHFPDVGSLITNRMGSDRMEESALVKCMTDISGVGYSSESEVTSRTGEEVLCGAWQICNQEMSMPVPTSWEIHIWRLCWCWFHCQAFRMILKIAGLPRIWDCTLHK